MANPKYEMSNNKTAIDTSVATVDMKLEAIVIPVSDVERAEEFYRKLGWRQDDRRRTAAMNDSPLIA